MGFFSDTMTVYNYRRETDGEHWRRTVVHGVQWRHGKRRMTADKGVFSDEPEESIIIDFDRMYKGNKPYLDPMEYRKLPEDQTAEFWTLDQSNGVDVAVCGEILQEINADYGISRLKKEFPAFTLAAVSDNRNRPRLKHIRAVAK